jgi:hypothetical protein
MADQQQQQDPSKSSIIGAIWNAITKDGTLAAAGRQGAAELAQALRAFPETLHADVPGTILNPTQGEIADSRSQKLPSPSEIARDKQPHRPEQEQEHDHGRGR